MAHASQSEGRRFDPRPLESTCRSVLGKDTDAEIALDAGCVNVRYVMYVNVYLMSQCINVYEWGE